MTKEEKEYQAALLAYKCGLGASEWEAFMYLVEETEE